MILIKDKQQCCGCSACAQICPKRCISLREDVEGFLYPIVEESLCIACGLCEKVCPVLCKKESKEPLAVFAAINPDEEIRKKSSSGGFFSVLAEKVLSNGGVVFGARFDEKWEVIHDFTESIEGLDAFRGSKYVQSIIGDSYKKAEDFLKDGRTVLFSGTPCQVSGLNHYLRKTYNNLILVEVACHGVSSHLVWQAFLDKLSPSKKSIAYISMKNKEDSWRGYKLLIKKEDGTILFNEKWTKTSYLCGFVNNLYLRPSCFQCSSKKGSSGSDILLADYWGIEKINPQMDDDKGTSMVVAFTQKGLDNITHQKSDIVKTNFQDAIKANPCIVESTKDTPYRVQFWSLWKDKGYNAVDIVLNTMQPSLFGKIFKRIKRFFS